MDEDLSIINTNTRNEKVKNFFINNRNKIISAVIILAVILVSVYSYDKYKTNQKKQISNNFNLTTLEYSEETKSITVEKLLKIINKKDPTYSPLSLYFIIDNKLISELINFRYLEQIATLVLIFFQILNNDYSSIQFFVFHCI